MNKIRTENYRSTIDENDNIIKHYRFILDLGLDSNGKRKTIKKANLNGKKFYSKKEAEEAGLEYYKMFIRGEIGEKKDVKLFSDFIDIWYEKMCNKMELTTTDNYKKVIKNHLKPGLGSYALDALNKPILENFLENLVKKGYKPSTINNIKFVLTKALKFAVNNKFTETDMYVVVRNLDYSVNKKNRSREKLSTQQNNDYITDENYKKIINRFKEDSVEGLSIRIAYHLGVRRAECFALTWNDFDFEKKQVTIKRQLQYDVHTQTWYLKYPKHVSETEYELKGDSVFRTIGIDDELIAILKRVKVQQELNKKSKNYVYPKVDENDGLNYLEGKDIDFVLQKKTGGFYSPGNTAQALSRIIHKELKIPFTFHSLRHTHCTNLAKANFNAFYISNRMGHKDFKTTQKYLHNDDDFIASRMEQLNGMFA